MHLVPWIPLIVIWAIVAPVIGFLPTIIGRNKKNCRAILALNFFGGWTGVGWIVAMVWACMEDSIEDAAEARPLNIRAVLGILIAINLASIPFVFWITGSANNMSEEAELKVKQEKREHEELVAAREQLAAEQLAKQDSVEAAPTPTPVSPIAVIFPSGVDTPEQRREYLKALTEQRKKAQQRPAASNVRTRGY